MSSPNEIFNGNSYGLRCMTPKDVRMIKRRTANHDFSPNADTPPAKPLYQKSQGIWGELSVTPE